MCLLLCRVEKGRALRGVKWRREGWERRRPISTEPRKESGLRKGGLLLVEGLRGQVSEWVKKAFGKGRDKGHLLMKVKFHEVVGWYEELTGLHAVRAAQDKVIEATEKFAKAQERRRQVMALLNHQQAQLKELYADLETTSRGQERYLKLITKEHSLLREEKAVKLELEEADKDERNSFVALATLVKESQSKEKVQSEKTKYWSIIGSVVGAVIGLLGTSINHSYRMKELKTVVLEKYSESVRAAEQHEKFLSTYMEEIKRMRAPPAEATINKVNAKQLRPAIQDEKKTASMTHLPHELQQSLIETHQQLHRIEALLARELQPKSYIWEVLLTCAASYVVFSIVSRLF